MKVQLSFEDCQNKFDNDKYQFLSLLDEAINLDEIVPVSFVTHFHASIPLIKAYILIEDSFLLEYDTITLEELSHRLGLSTRQTSRILFDRYGQNFLQKRTEARMAAAVTFLKENKLSLSEISSRLGYCYPNHFYAAFKKYYQMTATEYKRTVLHIL